MTLHALACAFADRTTAVMRHPLAILLAPLLFGGFVLIGWLLGEVSLFLLVLTTLLSVLALSLAQMQLLKQGKSDGEVE